MGSPWTALRVLVLRAHASFIEVVGSEVDIGALSRESTSTWVAYSKIMLLQSFLFSSMQ
jgi:hypothetical protein